MNNINTYTNQFFTFNNPLFFSLILSLAIILIILLFFWKFVLPLQQKITTENQRYLLEKAELMAHFSEMDPDPLIRINDSGDIIQTNESSRTIFPNIGKKGRKIWEIIPTLQQPSKEIEQLFIETINGQIFSVAVKRDNNMGFANVYLHDITKIKKYEYALEQYKNKLKSLTNELDTEFENLKKKLSSELHDDIGQKLLTLKLKISQIDKNDDSGVQSNLESIYQRIREISKTLQPMGLNTLGLMLSIQSMVYHVSELSGIKGSFGYFGEELKLHPNIETCVFRVVQEALNNIIKHAQANEFSVQLEYCKEKIKAVISDDGTGIPCEYFAAGSYDKFGTGLFRINERVENLGGTLQLNSTQGEATCLIIQLPIIKNGENGNDKTTFSG